MPKLKKITVKGYKSINELDNFELSDLNILIGANGAGKSNFINIFKLLANIGDQTLQLFTQKSGGPDSLLHFGRKKSEKIHMEFYFGANGYKIDLIPTNDNRLIFEKEMMYFEGDHGNFTYLIGQGNEEANLKSSTQKVAEYVRPIFSSWRVYHFHDTGDSAKVKQKHKSNDNLKLKNDGANLAAYLKRLHEDYNDNYQQIVKTIQMVAPFFGDFVFRESEDIELEWTEIGDPDTPFKAHALSDGTLRFICLSTLLLQPFKLMPDTILIDEPELGLHPYAINVLSDLISRASEKKQLIISSQSVELINNFEPQHIIAVDRENDCSILRRLDSDKLSDWLEDYTLGELWKRNILGARPSR